MAVKCMAMATVLVGGLAGGAFAATMQAEFAASVSDFEIEFAPKDDLNIFGGAADPGSLVGKPATIRFVFNTANAVSETIPLPGTTFIQDSISSTSPGSEGYMTVAEVVLNGATYALDLSAPDVAAKSLVSRNVSTLDDTETWFYLHRATTSLISQTRERTELIYIAPSFFGPTALPIMLDEEFSTGLAGPDWISTPFQQLVITDYDPTTLPDGAPIPETNLLFRLSSLTVTCLDDCGDEEPPAVIPLPASGVLLLGAGAALAVVRRRNVRAL